MQQRYQTANLTMNMCDFGRKNKVKLLNQIRIENGCAKRTSWMYKHIETAIKVTITYSKFVHNARINMQAQIWPFSKVINIWRQYVRNLQIFMLSAMKVLRHVHLFILIVYTCRYCYWESDVPTKVKFTLRHM